MSSVSSSNATSRCSIHIAKTKDEVEACYDIRMEVFVVEQGFPVDTEIDDYDPISTHFFLNVPITDPPPESTSFITLPSVTSSSTLKPVGTVRWTPSKAKVSRLALLPAARKQGYGRQLLEAVHRHAEETASTEEMRSVSERSGEKSIYAIPFYEKMGYAAEGPEFDEDGAPHMRMVRQIAFEPL
ncbi:MAG: hypothetical protein TREMPRED_000773 [Tremellales sp. Tagirdzhanova-0007]|nr:MAG: hypothetical protein TREMPRED_000773 [Tremellales sp. Tagirdzhanova-0007]